MAVKLDLQNDDALAGLPAPSRFKAWVEAALQKSHRQLEQTIRIVGRDESRQLNARFRGKDAVTNVLAFPSDAEFPGYDCFGDLVICAPVVENEATTQGKALEAHWAHMVVHGMLHLQGFDHQQPPETRQMEALEIKILDTLGYTNPYNE